MPPALIKAIYEQLAKAVKTPAAQTVFIDDIPEFVQAARSLGLHGIQYLDPAQLRSDLSALDSRLAL